MGPRDLSSRELLAAVLGTGARGASALDVADALLGDGLVPSPRAPSWISSARAGSAGPRPRASWPRWSWARGSRPRTRRQRASLRVAGGGGALPAAALRSRPVETFGLLALDARHRLRREAVVSVGCLTASLVHPREVFQEAVVSRAAALVLFHNHPSGDPEPSAEDVALTRRLSAAGSLMGIEILDHLVLGAGRYVSLKERGVL